MRPMRKVENDRRHDARRLETQSNKAKRWRLAHPEYDRDRRRTERKLYGRTREDAIMDLVAHERALKFKSTNCLVAADFHIPFHDDELLVKLLDVAKEHSVKDLAIPGDFWDCDNFKEFLGEPWRISFQQEIENAQAVLQVLADHFDHIWFCKGNHERRWIKGNLGVVTLHNLFAMTEVKDNYECTDDNYLVLNPHKEPWLLCHPKNFSAISLRVPTRLASKYRMNVLSAHGHHWGQGIDDSGDFQVVEAGGMFAKKYIQYLRDISLYPETCSGFYLIQDGAAKPFKGVSAGVIEL